MEFPYLVDKWYILPIGWLYGAYRLLREPGGSYWLYISSTVIAVWGILGICFLCVGNICKPRRHVRFRSACMAMPFPTFLLICLCIIPPKRPLNERIVLYVLREECNKNYFHIVVYPSYKPSPSKGKKKNLKPPLQNKYRSWLLVGSSKLDKDTETSRKDILFILLTEEILHHLGCIKPRK